MWDYALLCLHQVSGLLACDGMRVFIHWYQSLGENCFRYSSEDGSLILRENIDIRLSNYKA